MEPPIQTTATSSETSESNESCVSRDEFNEICRRLYRPCQTKTMRKDRCDTMVRYLKGLELPAQGSWRYRMEKKGYTLVNFAALGLKDVLCVKGTETNGVVEQGLYKQWRRVVPVEEFYDVLIETHVKVQKHGGYKNLLKAVQRNYAGVPREAAVRFVGLCSVCQRNPQQRARTARAIETNRERVLKVPCLTSAFNVRTQVDVIKMSTNSDGGYTHVGLYMDQWTRFITLFPMMGWSVDHVAYGLASSVFPYFGPPLFLHSPEGKEFADQVIQLGMATWKGGQRMTLPQGKPGLEQLGKAMEEIRTTLIHKIDERAEAEDVYAPLPWASWLGKIMFDINNETNKETGRSPYSRVFERTMSMSQAGEHRQPIKDLAFKDRSRERKAVAANPPPQPQTAGQQGGLTLLIDGGMAQAQGFFIQQSPIIIQAHAAPSTSTTTVTTPSTADEADDVLPVAATAEVLRDSHHQLLLPPSEEYQRQTFTSNYLDPSSGQVQSFVIDVVEPAAR